MDAQLLQYEISLGHNRNENNSACTSGDHLRAELLCTSTTNLAFTRARIDYLSEISNLKSEIADVPDSDTFLQTATHLPKRPAIIQVALRTCWRA